MSRLSDLNPARRIIVAGAAILVVLLIVFMGRLAAQPQMSLLYSGLEPTAAAEVISQLEADGIAFDVRGSAIYVPENMRDRARLDLAGAGLPSGGSAGYELLETLSGFGTTSQMFDAAYRRAQEGELARTIAASPDIRAARVHISQINSGPFSNSNDASASVTITMSRGTVSVAQADAIRHLVSAALPGVLPDTVSIIDSTAGRVIAIDAPGEDGNVSQRADEMRNNLQRLLEARVGPGRAIVEVNVEAVTDSETITERVIDPESRVAISSDVEEDLENSAGTAPGAVTVASNLPDGDAAGEAGENRREVTRTRERTNFEVSEILRERVRGPGDIRRLGIAVLVDGVRVTNAAGELEWRPRAAEEMAALEDLVKSAVGFDEQRGDQMTLQSLEFPDLPGEGVEVASPSIVEQIPLGSIVQIGILGLVVLALGLLVVRPMMANRSRGPELLNPDPTELLETTQTVNNPTDQIPEEPEKSVPQEVLRANVAARSDEAAAIVKSWIDSDLMMESRT